MSTSKRLSVSKLQKEIHKQLTNLQSKRPFSLTSLPSQDSLRSSFSKSVKSIFFDEDSKKKKNQSFKQKSPSPKSFIKDSKLGRSQDVVGLKKIKSNFGNLKKKKSQGMTREFTTMSRKNSEPTQISTVLSSFQSFNESQYHKLVEKNKIYEQKIQNQKNLIQKLESIIEEMTN